MTLFYSVAELNQARTIESSYQFSKQNPIEKMSTDKAGSSRQNRRVDRFVAKLTPNEDMVFIENKFWLKFQGEIRGRNVILMDPAGFTFNVSVEFHGYNEVGIMTGVENIVTRYNLVKSYWVLFTYKGNCEFDIRVVNGNVEVNYPRVETDEDVDVQPVEYEEDPEEPLFMWEVTLTKAAASGANALLIPARIVRDILDNNQEVVTVIDEGGELIPCKVLKPKRRPSERYLSSGWYEFIRGKKLKVGDKIRFYSDDSMESLSAVVERI
ncbi:DNA-binding barrel domain superfamily [Sesbania bispinosa]|nr:DNA-binding barrel domain superfamily [Sesbania bispinosa]